MKTILDEIFDTKRRRVEETKCHTDLGRLAESAHRVRAAAVKHSFRQALANREQVNIIAEFKKASPSKGTINDETAPEDAARRYESRGACAVSVLTEEDFFRGSLADLEEVRRAVRLPVLRKDFLFDEFQIFEAAAAGADAVLLIAASLAEDELRRLRSVTEDDLGMDALVEVHTADDMAKAVAVGARLIGINNRDLKTFEVSLDVSRGLIASAPPDAVLVSESGLRSITDIEELSTLGFSGFLIGEILMQSEDPEGLLMELRGMGRQAV
jgi:indole-3-glycerol phosphate synthase